MEVGSDPFPFLVKMVKICLELFKIECYFFAVVFYNGNKIKGDQYHQYNETSYQGDINFIFFGIHKTAIAYNKLAVPFTKYNIIQRSFRITGFNPRCTMLNDSTKALNP